MEEREIEGRTIDEAIERACAAFAVPREKLRIDILAEGTAGFLGLGAKKARIRASLLTLDMSFDAPPPRRERRSPAERPEAEEKAPRASERAATPGPPPSRPERAKNEPPAAAEQPRRLTTPAQAPADQPAATTLIAESSPVAEDPPAEKARSILEGLLARMQIESPVGVEETEEAIVLNIRGDGSGLIIGKRGQNLDAIQYFVNKAVHHSANGQKMIVIDTEEYRKRREESLVALALRLGEKAKQTNKPVTVGHLNAHDRRTVHLAVRNDPALTTKSRGEGEYRKILILPARRGPDPAGG